MLIDEKRVILIKKQLSWNLFGNFERIFNMPTNNKNINLDVKNYFLLLFRVDVINFLMGGKNVLLNDKSDIRIEMCSVDKKANPSGSENLVI